MLQQLQIIVLTGILLVIFPFLFLVFVLMSIYRTLISKIAVILKPKLGNLLSPSSAAFATDLVYNNVQKIPLLVTVYLDGHLDVEEFRRRMLDVIDQKDETTQQYVRPELQQYVTTWCGLLFWKWEKSFDVSEHVRLWSEYAHIPMLNEDAILEIGNQMFQKPFAQGKSPWEFLVLYNTRAKDDFSEDPRTTILFRVHHGLADGYSLLKLVMSDMSGVQMRLAQPLERKRGQTSLLRSVMLPYKCARDLARTLVCCYDNNDWHLPTAKMTGRINGGVSNPISLGFVKSAKNKHSVTFAALLLAAFAGGVKKFMASKGLTVPKQIHCFTILPFSNHPYTLTNHLTGGIVLLPLGEDCAVKRLAIVHKSLENLKRSTLPLTMFYLIQLAGVQLGWIGWKCFWNPLHTAVMSNFPGPEDECECLGLSILDGGFAAGFGPGNATLGFSSLSYNGKLRVATGFDEAILPKSISCAELVQYILDEISLLESRT